LLKRIDYPYVLPNRLRQGHGRAIGFYKANGFRLVRETDGAGNEEREPDALFAWSR